MGWFSKDIDGKDLFSHFVMMVGFVYFMDTKTFKREFNTNTEEGFDHFKIFAPLLMDLTYGSLPRGVKATQEQELNVMFASQLVRNALFIEELRNAGWYEKTSQAFVVFLPVKSVGVVGDARRYEYVVSLRAVETIDFMTARWAHLPYDLLEKVSNRIINEISGISRVSYDISSKPPATIEWE